jgi:hypothetical protein
MKHLILDPFQHAPYLKYVYGNDCDYMSVFVTGIRWIQPYSNIQEFIGMYGFEPLQYNIDDSKLENKYDTIFIVYPLDILDEEKHPLNYNQFCDFIKEIQQKIHNKVHNKFIIIDNSDLANDKTIELQKIGIVPSFIFKKDYNKNIEYSPFIKYYPYGVMGKNDCMTILNNKRLNNSKVSDKIFWSGSINSTKDLKYYLNYDRKYWIDNCPEIYNLPFDGNPSYGSSNFLNTMSSFKYSCYLKGYSGLSRRFYEIMAVNSLMFIEKTDTKLELESELLYNPECEFDSLEKLNQIYNNINNDYIMYNKLLEKQNYIRDKYFSYQYIRQYIDKIINNLS